MSRCNAIYSRTLVYNACWEDNPLVITSAGCNVLDYALLGPKRINAVDANPRQTALLELKPAGLRHLALDDFFAAFGDGYHAGQSRFLWRAASPPDVKYAVLTRRV